MRNKSFRVSLRGMLRLIRVDTLRIVHNVGFPVERLIYLMDVTKYMYIFITFKTFTYIGEIEIW